MKDLFVGDTVDEIISILSLIIESIGQTLSITHLLYSIFGAPVISVIKFGLKQKETKEYIDDNCVPDVYCPTWATYFDDRNTMNMIFARPIYFIVHMITQPLSVFWFVFSIKPNT